MGRLDELYRVFGVTPDCTDIELRRAYHATMLRHHPDRNPNRVGAATVKTQQLTTAYAELKEHRLAGSARAEQAEAGQQGTGTVGDIEWTIRFSFSFDGVDVQDIASRKAEFREAWQNLRQHPTDPISALRLIHAAFRAERQDAVRDLLHNLVLIDSASLLLSFVGPDDASETLVRWARFLDQNQRTPAAVQILEDAFVSGRSSSSSVADELRRLHYAWAQYGDPTTGAKALPEVRIEHLNRILEIGFEYGYIYKLLAEAYHDIGDDEQARTHLKEAYRIDPQLSGAVRISRALGFAQQAKPARRCSSVALQRSKCDLSVQGQLRVTAASYLPMEPDHPIWPRSALF